MKAALVNSYGSIDHISVSDTQVPAPGKDEVLIQSAFAGVNYPDVLITRGLYQYRPDLPFSPGGEVSGVVKSVGEEVTDIKVGDTIIGASGWGAFAEYAVMPASNCYVVADDTDLKKAAVILETYATGIHALKDRADIKNGERLVVLGAAGGTGTAAIQLGKAMGAEVVAVASTTEKLNFCKENGADRLINYHDQNVKFELKNLGGTDVIFDPVGGDVSELAFRSLNPFGRHLVVGFTSGEIPSVSWNLPLLKSASIMGVFWGGFWRNFPDENRKNVEVLLQWLNEGKISPIISKEYSLNEIREALNNLNDRKVLGKQIIRF